jgi:hypothetical protein
VRPPAPATPRPRPPPPRVPHGLNHPSWLAGCQHRGLGRRARRAARGGVGGGSGGGARRRARAEPGGGVAGEAQRARMSKGVASSSQLARRAAGAWPQRPPRGPGGLTCRAPRAPRAHPAGAASRPSPRQGFRIDSRSPKGATGGRWRWGPSRSCTTPAAPPKGDAWGCMRAGGGACCEEDRNCAAWSCTVWRRGPGAAAPAPERRRGARAPALLRRYAARRAGRAPPGVRERSTCLVTRDVARALHPWRRRRQVRRGPGRTVARSRGARGQCGRAALTSAAATAHLRPRRAVSRVDGVRQPSQQARVGEGRRSRPPGGLGVASKGWGGSRFQKRSEG